MRTHVSLQFVQWLLLKKDCENQSTHLGRKLIFATVLLVVHFNLWNNFNGWNSHLAFFLTGNIYSKLLLHCYQLRATSLFFQITGLIKEYQTFLASEWKIYTWWLYILLHPHGFVAQNLTQFTDQNHNDLEKQLLSIWIIHFKHRRVNEKLLLPTYSYIGGVKTDNAGQKISQLCSKTRWASNAFTGRDVHKYCMNRQNGSSKQKWQ